MQTKVYNQHISIHPTKHHCCYSLGSHYTWNWMLVVPLPLLPEIRQARAQQYSDLFLTFHFCIHPDFEVLFSHFEFVVVNMFCLDKVEQLNWKNSLNLIRNCSWIASGLQRKYDFLFEDLCTLCSYRNQC